MSIQIETLKNSVSKLKQKAKLNILNSCQWTCQATSLLPKEVPPPNQENLTVELE